MARDLTKIYYERDNVECQKYDVCKNIPGLNQPLIATRPNGDGETNILPENLKNRFRINSNCNAQQALVLKQTLQEYDENLSFLKFLDTDPRTAEWKTNALSILFLGNIGHYVSVDLKKRRLKKIYDQQFDYQPIQSPAMVELFCGDGDLYDIHEHVRLSGSFIHRLGQ
jgi:hypothetical protein